MSLRRLLCAAAMLALSLPASAQTVTGTIQGTVTDTSGAVLPVSYTHLTLPTILRV